MACEKYQELLQLYLDQSLSKSETKKLKRHLDECSRCRIDFVLYRKVFETLEIIDEPTVPDALLTDISSALEREPLVTSSTLYAMARPVKRHGWALGLAAVILLAVGIFYSTSMPVGPLPRPVLTASFDDGSLGPAEDGNADNALARPMLTIFPDGDDVTVLRHGSIRWQAVMNEMPLAFGDRIHTGPATKALVYYRDRGRITLHPNSDMQVLASGVRIKKGRIWVKIHKRGDSFYAETPNAVASVRGTAYSVDYSPAPDERSIVSVFKGTVAVSTGTHDCPGEITLVNRHFAVNVGSSVSTPAPITMDTYLAYNMLPPASVITGPSEDDTSDQTPDVGATGNSANSRQPGADNGTVGFDQLHKH